jgi:hypothetical protein
LYVRTGKIGSIWQRFGVANPNVLARADKVIK